MEIGRFKNDELGLGGCLLYKFDCLILVYIMIYINVVG